MRDRDFSAVEATLSANAVHTSGAQSQQVLLATLQAIGAGDFAVLPQYFTDDVEFQIHGFLTMDGSWHGVTEVVAVMASNFDRLTGQKPAIEAMIQQGDSIAIRFHETGQLKDNNAAYVARGVIWFSFVDNRINRVEEFVHSALLP